MLGGMHHTSRFVRSLLLVAALCLCLTQTVTAASLKLSGDGAVEGTVESFIADPTGRYAVYAARLPITDFTNVPVPNLFSVPLGGGEPVRLTDLGNRASYLQAQIFYKISPDGKWVVFTANNSTFDDVYAVPIQGGAAPIALNTSSVGVVDFAISPNSREVFFAVRNFVDKFHLYRAPLDGSTPAVEITAPDGSALMVETMQFTPDNSRLLFEGGLSDPITWGVYSMPVEDTGSQLIKLTKPLDDSLSFYYAVTADSRYVVYLYDTYTHPDEIGIYTVPVAGPVEQNLKVSGNQPPTAQMGVTAMDPTGRQLVFVVNESGGYMAPEVLYSTSLVRDGSGMHDLPIKLNGELAAGMVIKSDGVVISPDGAMVAYETEGITNSLDLYLAPIDGPAGSSVLINHGSDILTNLEWHLPHFSPDSQRLVFVAQRDTPGQFDLYSVPTSILVSGLSMAVTRLSLPMTPSSPGAIMTVSYPVITQDSQMVYYAAETQPGLTDLFRVPISGPASANQNLTGFSVDGSNVSALVVAPNQRGLLYTQHLRWTNGELYLSEPPPTKIYLPAIGR